MFKMLVEGFGENDDIVDVDEAKISVVLEDHVHSPLKGSGGITQTKRHDSKLARAKFGLERCAFDVRGVNSDLVETLSQVHLREEVTRGQEIQEFVDPR